VYSFAFFLVIPQRSGHWCPWTIKETALEVTDLPVSYAPSLAKQMSNLGLQLTEQSCFVIHQ